MVGDRQKERRRKGTLKERTMSVVSLSDEWLEGVGEVGTGGKKKNKKDKKKKKKEGLVEGPRQGGVRVWRRRRRKKRCRH